MKKDNIDNALEFLDKMTVRLFYFAFLMVVISAISLFFSSMYNKDIAIKVFFINMSIGLIPLIIVLLLYIIYQYIFIYVNHY